MEATNDRENSFQYLELNKGSFRLGYQTGLTVQVTSIPVYVVHILDTVCDTQLSQMFQEGWKPVIPELCFLWLLGEKISTGESRVRTEVGARD